MNQYQIAQLSVALVYAVFILCFILIVRWFHRGKAPPALYYGLCVAILTAFSFWLGDLASATPNPPGQQTLDVLVKHVRNLPITLIVVYLSLMQARRYRRARKRDWINVSLRSSKYVVPTTFAFSFFIDIVVKPPVLAVVLPIGFPVALYNAPFYLSLILLSGLNAYVFLSALLHPAPIGVMNYQTRRKLQNACGCILSSSLTLLALTTTLWYVSRASLAPQTLQHTTGLFSTVQLTALVVAGFAGTIGLALHFGQDEYDKVMERVSSLVEPVCDAMELLASVPVSNAALSRPHTYMNRAADSKREGFLGLADRDRVKMGDTFRAGVLMCQQNLPDIKQPPVNKEQLMDLAKAYDQHDMDENLAGWIADLGILSANGAKAINSTGDGLSKPLSRAYTLTTNDIAYHLPDFEDWAQLAAIALADAGVLPKRQCDVILEGDVISGGVINAYQAAKVDIKYRPTGLN